MAHDTTVQFRIDSTVKEEAFAVFQKMGISPSEAVRVFLKQVQLTQTLPFPLAAANEQDLDVEDDYTQWLRQRLATAVKQLDSGKMKRHDFPVAKAMLGERLAARRSAFLANGATGH
ncbi:type II toxin-antitoxin system RelB/DinJ family antitoxin [Rhodoferax sp.]|uniref:type II toxin-antitoxin system RelB/DinJ family antitoxin n=1 Tax=Rhodoferax sp. TaxID=50421 RepID=UPI001A01F212|nr:type II toxin-antitoxin system RelB/DinJ family antitoxin [Rhodoferax sp.]MBE0474227.1 type II toxin-antitoxin system RelB/DinJ family antitoxin [Rhodoferax sp.]